MIAAPAPSELGEIAPLKTKWEASEIVPSWRISVLPGSSSYQRMIERPPGPSIVCCVHTASSSAAGSVSATAWVNRASSESSTRGGPGCGTLAGKSNALTFMFPSSLRVGVPDGPLMCQAITWLGLATSNGESAATTYPFGALSKVFAGTGVNTRPPSAVSSGSAAEPFENTAGVVQLVSPLAGFGIAQIREVRNSFWPGPPLLSKTFVPIRMWLSLWPSFG